MFVLTSTASNARTTTNAFIRLHGSQGNSDERKLTTKTIKEDFEEGQTKVFLFNIYDVGNVEAVTISHDSSNPWKVEHVVIVDTNNNKAWKCQYSEFLEGEHESTTKSCKRGREYIFQI